MHLQLLGLDFYQQPTIAVAQHLLGKYLIHRSNEGKTVGRIVETEGYLSGSDPASHAFRGKTTRNAAMFGAPGRVYIYFIYGMYYCFNVTTAPEAIGEAVLLRALDPVDGISLMQARRKSEKIDDLCRGPAKLVIAMGITPDLGGHDLRAEPLTIAEDLRDEPPQFTATARIGITRATDLPLRYAITGNRFVSR
ncbi:MAG: DNA-3-methyladenine glycosylase [Dehalococcoidia bacterium]